MIITLSGFPGAGKSTLKKALAEVLGYKAYSVGDMRGKMAEARGMTIDAFNALGMKEAFTDKDVDEFQKALGEKEDNFVIDGRLSWLFIPKSVKIFLSVDPDIAAKRIFTDRHMKGHRSDEPLYSDPEEAKTYLTARLQSDRARYQKWYGIDFADPKNFDLILDTSNRTTEETLTNVLDFLKTR